MIKHAYRIKESEKIKDIVLNKVRFTKDWKYYNEEQKQFNTYLDSFIEYQVIDTEKVNEDENKKIKDELIKKELIKLENEKDEEEIKEAIGIKINSYGKNKKKLN